MMMMVVVMIKMIVITIVSSVLFEGDIPSWQRGGQYPSCHFFTSHDDHDVDDNLNHGDDWDVNDDDIVVVIIATKS